jgi:hypothetical protein
MGIHVDRCIVGALNITVIAHTYLTNATIRKQSKHPIRRCFPLTIRKKVLEKPGLRRSSRCGRAWIEPFHLTDHSKKPKASGSSRVSWRYDLPSPGVCSRSVAAKLGSEATQHAKIKADCFSPTGNRTPVSRARYLWWQAEIMTTRPSKMLFVWTDGFCLMKTGLN